jgi:hypothetical protein
VPDESALYALAGLAFVAPELREGRGEVEAAASGALPSLVSPTDVRGVLHCHSDYSDGTTSIAEMAAAARARGWSYLGITDHSQSAFYAGGLTRESVLRQHDEIDALNERLDAEGAAFRVLKGIEADILEDGRVDYGDDLLDRFDYVIGSVHSRFGMSDALGPVTFEHGHSPFLPMTDPFERHEVSEETAELIDREVKAVITREQNRAREVLQRRRGALEAVAQELIVRETLEREQLDEIVKRADVRPNGESRPQLAPPMGIDK